MHHARPPRILVLAVMALALVFSAGCGNNMEKFRQIKAGMTLDQVKDILGTPDSIREAQGLAAIWVYKSAGLFGDGSTLMVSSLGGKVVLATIRKE